MSAKPQFQSPDDLLPSVDYPPAIEQAVKPELKVVSETPPPAVPRATPGDPLAAIKAMSEEEKIALFS